MQQRVLFVFIAFLVINCNQSDDMQSQTMYYRDFDIFNLIGTDKLKKVDTDESVEVRYGNNIPIYIKYYKRERTITLLLEDSFSVNDRSVYVYETSNLHGGQPGKTRVYGSHYEEHKDRLYVSLSDTLLCERKDVPETKNFMFDLFVKRKTSDILQVSKGEYDYGGVNSRLTKENLYLKWYALLQEESKKIIEKPVIINKIPG